jgi:hypothetical protein
MKLLPWLVAFASIAAVLYVLRSEQGVYDAMQRTREAAGRQ